MLRSLLEHPLARGRDLDEASTTALRRGIIASKPFLLDIYADWYSLLAAAVPGRPGAVVELGSGAGSLRAFIPDLIRTDVQFLPGIDAVGDAARLPFSTSSLRALLMTNVLHHVQDSEAFLTEASRCLRPGGVVAMIEPWVTPWSRLVYSKLHHEPFDPCAVSWTLPMAGPLSGANGALPWIVLVRDRDALERTWPELEIVRVEPIMPFRYLLSGGVSLRSLMPGWTSGFWRGVERALTPVSDYLGMFAFVIIRRH